MARFARVVVVVVMDAKVFEATSREKEILADIKTKTGLEFHRLGGIKSQDAAIFSAVGPVLVGWVAGSDASHRRAIYSRFHTPYAHIFLEELLGWWRAEEDGLGSGLLTQAITRALTCEDASRVWGVLRAFQEPPPFFYMLAAKLANCPATQREARERIIAGLTSEYLEAGDLNYIATVKDPRIRSWFEGHLNSTNPGIRTVARRVVAQRALPKGVEYSPAPPEGSADAVVFHTECDLDQFPDVFREPAIRFGLKAPAAVRSGSFLASAEIDRWVVVGVTTQQRKSASLWFRLEDIDTVEFLILLEQ